MCGIAGLIGLRPVNVATVSAMATSLAHRGPDDSGIWTSPDRRVVLANRRLAIFDTSSAGHQPMVRGAHVVTFNGAIYNHLEIAHRLKEEGVTFASRSDTEVLLAAYGRWGEDCVREFNGMFAFAIYDAERNRLFCARDRFGEKPFLYRTAIDHFIFASEYKALLTVGEQPITIDDGKLAAFLIDSSQGLDDGAATVFGGVAQLPPAHRLTLELNSMTTRVERYWDVAPNPALARLGDAEAQARFRELLTDSVRLRLRADVPQGSCLSGGLDSTSVVCIARELLGDDTPYDTFTGRFAGSAADESPWAEIVTTAKHTRPHLADPSAAALADELSDFVWFNELPTGSASQYAQWCVFRLAKQSNVTVLLDGQGGDELLGGYEQYFRAYLASLDPSRAESESAAIRARYPMALASTRERRARAVPMGLAYFVAGATGLGSDVRFGLASHLVSEKRDSRTPLPGAERFNPLAAALYRDLLHTNLTTLLRYGDRNSMAHAREVRLPFCDHRLAEFVLSLAPERLMGGAETKRLLRGALTGLIPESIRTRWSKQGFLPPHADWLRGPLAPALRELIMSTEFADSGFWRARWWRRALDRFQRGDDALAMTLWRPFMAEAWRRHFVQRLSRMPRLPVFAEG